MAAVRALEARKALLTGARLLYGERLRRSGRSPGRGTTSRRR
jgi:hypothetical protein